jgi:hypothetical protein
MEVKTGRKGIPTLYKNVLFRSRLEARWAAVFDAFGWPWAYEPIDLEWYVPDFILRFPAGPLVVEVKPETQLADLATHAKRIVGSGWAREFVVLGASTFGSDVLGVIGEPVGRRESIVGPARVFRCINCGSLSILHDDHSWQCRVEGCCAGNAHVEWLADSILSEVWTSAGNRVQWKAAG